MELGFVANLLVQAALGQYQVIGGVLGFQVDGFTEGLERAPPVVQFLADHAQIVGSEGIFGTEHHGLGIVFFCLLEVALALVGLSQVILRIGVLGVEFQGPFKAGDRFVDFSQLQSDRAELVNGGCEVRIVLYSPFIADHGQIGTVQLFAAVGQQQVAVGVVLVQIETLLDLLHGHFVFGLLHQHSTIAKIVSGLVGIELDRLFQMLDGQGALVFAFVDHRELEVRVRIARVGIDGQFEVVDGQFVLLELGVDLAAGVIGLPEPGVDIQRSLQALQRKLEQIEELVGRAQLIVGESVLGVDQDGLGEVLDRAVDLLLVFPLSMRIGGELDTQIGVQVERFGPFDQRAIGVARSSQVKTPVKMGKRVAWIKLEADFVRLDGFRNLTSVLVGETERKVIVRIVRLQFYQSRVFLYFL